MKTFWQYLNEASYTQSDIPKYFWVVFDLEAMKDELKTGKVKGLKGISSHHNIQFQFLGVARDAMLQIPSKDLLAVNNVTRIMYDNPHYLVSNNLWALKRIYDTNHSSWVNHVFGNLFEQIQKNIKDDNYIRYDMGYYGFRNIDREWSNKISNKKINNIKQLAVVIKDYIDKIFSKKTGKEYNIKLNDLMNAITETLKNIGKVYSTENEWVVKDSVFTVPKTSILYVLAHKPANFNQKFFDVVKNNMKASIMDTIFILREHDLPDSYGKEWDVYKRYAKMITLSEGLPYKRVFYNADDFKRKQMKYWESGK
jgi:hypothetical protein